jgi:hypothetical protein
MHRSEEYWTDLQKTIQTFKPAPQAVEPLLSPIAGEIEAL